MTTSAKSRADSVQKVTSPGGIEAWLVEDYAVPLVAFEFAFHGGTTQDTPARAGAMSMLSALLDEGAGPYDADAFHRAMDDKAVEISFSSDRDTFHGRMKTLARHLDDAAGLLRLAVMRGVQSIRQHFGAEGSPSQHAWDQASCGRRRAQHHH